MKVIIISIVVALLLVGGAFVITKNRGGAESATQANNVSVVDGTQIIEIDAKGGYRPRKSVAQEGLPTIIRFNTKSTFDCSSFVRIPSLNISTSLPQSGATDIDIGVGKVGTLKGSCGMGMYPFEIEFRG